MFPTLVESVVDEQMAVLRRLVDEVMPPQHEGVEWRWSCEFDVGTLSQVVRVMVRVGEQPPYFFLTPISDAVLRSPDPAALGRIVNAVRQGVEQLTLHAFPSWRVVPPDSDEYRIVSVFDQGRWWPSPDEIASLEDRAVQQAAVDRLARQLDEMVMGGIVNLAPGTITTPPVGWEPGMGPTDAAFLAAAREQERERVQAEATARRLLEEHLTDEQRGQLQRSGQVWVSSKRYQGRHYTVPNDGGRIRVHEGEGGDFVWVAELCVDTAVSLPVSDRLLAKVLWLQADEDGLLQTANWFGPGGSPASWSVRWLGGYHDERGPD